MLHVYLLVNERSIPFIGINHRKVYVVQRKIITVKKSNEFQYHRNNKIILKMQQLILIDKLYFLFKKIFENCLHFYFEKNVELY